MSVLSCQNAGVRFGAAWLLRGLDLALAHGRLTALVGPNGSGKSTAMRLLAGWWRVSEGSVRLDGRELQRWGVRERARRIAVVPQEVRLDAEFTVGEVVAMGRYPHERRWRPATAADASAVAEALRLADLTAMADRYVTRLSGGERQRVLLARCLAAQADVVLLDEPTSNLDLAHGLDVLGLCRSLAGQGRAVAMATHDLQAAMQFADEVVVLSGGRRVAGGVPGEVLNESRIAEVFGVRAERAMTPTGRPVLGFYR